MSEIEPSKLQKLLEIKRNDLTSFEYGTLAALACLKAAIQDEPDNRIKTLETAAKYFLARENVGEDPEKFKLPLRMIQADRSGLQDRS